MARWEADDGLNINLLLMGKFMKGAAIQQRNLLKLGQLVPLEYLQDNPKISVIKGCSKAKRPLFIYFPVIAFVFLGINLMLLASKVRRKRISLAG